VGCSRSRFRPQTYCEMRQHAEASVKTFAGAAHPRRLTSASAAYHDITAGSQDVSGQRGALTGHRQYETDLGRVVPDAVVLPPTQELSLCRQWQQKGYVGRQGGCSIGRASTIAPVADLERAAYRPAAAAAEWRLTRSPTASDPQFHRQLPSGTSAWCSSRRPTRPRST
jgi:hypothetical protein